MIVGQNAWDGEWILPKDFDEHAEMPTPFAPPLRPGPTVGTTTLGRPNAEIARIIRAFVFKCNKGDVEKKQGATNVTIPLIQKHCKQQHNITLTKHQIRIMLRMMGFRWGRADSKRICVLKETSVNIEARHLYIKYITQHLCPITGLPLCALIMQDESYCNKNHTRRETWYHNSSPITQASGKGDRVNIIGACVYYVDWDKVTVMTDEQWSARVAAMRLTGVDVQPADATAHGVATPTNALDFLQWEWVKIAEETSDKDPENTGPKMWMTDKTTKDNKRVRVELDDYHLNTNAEYFEKWFIAACKAVEDRFKEWEGKAWYRSPVWVIDGASSHTKCDDKAPSDGGWEAKHTHLAKMGVDAKLYAHLKSLKKGGGYLN